MILLVKMLLLMSEMIMITTNNSLFKDRVLVKKVDLNKLKIISQVNDMVETKVDLLYDDIKERYIVNEDKVYDRLYLKVRKMFLEEDN